MRVLFLIGMFKTLEHFNIFTAKDFNAFSWVIRTFVAVFFWIAAMQDLREAFGSKK